MGRWSDIWTGMTAHRVTAISGEVRNRSSVRVSVTMPSRGRERIVVCGDFNAYDGLEEVEETLGAAGLVLHDPGETVPPRPLDGIVTETRTLDLFLTSPDVAVTRCAVIPVQVSDHRPIVLEFED